VEATLKAVLFKPAAATQSNAPSTAATTAAAGAATAIAAVPEPKPVRLSALMSVLKTGSTGHTAVAAPRPAPAAVRLSALMSLLPKRCTLGVAEALDSAAITAAATSAAATSAVSTQSATGGSATASTDGSTAAPVSTGVALSVEVKTPAPTEEVRVQALLHCLLHIYKCTKLLDPVRWHCYGLSS
jgi:hypothetical protein